MKPSVSRVQVFTKQLKNHPSSPPGPEPLEGQPTGKLLTSLRNATLATMLPVRVQVTVPYHNASISPEPVFHSIQLKIYKKETAARCLKNKLQP